VSRLLPPRLLLLTVLALAHVAPVSAQRGGRVLLISGRSVPAGVRRAATDALEQAATLIDPQRYARASANAGLQPDSLEALERVAPSMNAQLVVLIAAREQNLRVSFRRPASDQTLRELTLRLHHGKLERAARTQLTAATRQALASAAAAEPAAANGTPAIPQSDEPRQASAAVNVWAAGAAAPEPAAADEGPPPTTAEAADASGESPDTVPTAPAEQSASALTAALAAGAGIGQRWVQLPARRGVQRLDSGIFPALDLLVSIELAAGAHWSFGTQTHYQTSLGTDATTTPVNGALKQTSLRTHHLDLGLTAGVRFSDSDAGVSLRLFAGWAFRGLRPVVDIDIPGYSLHGPVLRPELRIPIADGAVVLNIAPELVVLAHLSSELAHAGSTAHAGLSFGGELSLDVRISRRLFASVAYRESHATVSSSWSSDFTDVERFGTARIGLRY
jgi:hypothetical protein